MTRRMLGDDERLRNLLDALAESAADLTDSEILAEVRDDGEDPVSVASQMRVSALEAVKSVRQQKLLAAREAYKIERSRLLSRHPALPATPEERRALLDATLRRQPELREAFTLAARELRDVPDDDVESLLRQLEALGAFDEPPPKQGT